MKRKDITDLLKTIDSLPSMPGVILKALNVADDSAASFKEIANIMKKDQSLVTCMLKLVNSAYYGFPSQITSLEKALSLIGLLKAKKIIVSAAMKPMFTDMNCKDLWLHSIRCGIGASFIASKLNSFNPEEAFIVGFLHDIGKMVLMNADSNAYQKIIEDVDKGGDILRIEAHVFGINHCDVGVELFKKWNLPLILLNGIKYHHNPMDSSMNDLCSLVYIADVLSQKNEQEIDEDFLMLLDFEIGDISALRQAIYEQSEEFVNNL